MAFVKDISWIDNKISNIEAAIERSNERIKKGFAIKSKKESHEQQLLWQVKELDKAKAEKKILIKKESKCN